MPATVSHALSMTTPSDPAWECQPQHWNSVHNITLNAVGSEISGAFANSPTVSFGLSAGSITASANVTAAPSPVIVTGANGSSVSAQTIQFDNANGMTLGVSTAANGATVTGSYTVPTSYVSRVNGSSGAISLVVGSSLSSSTNGSTITFGLASNITSALQSAGNYLTTARASNDAIGLNSAVSNVAATINSSGLSLDARGYAGTGTAITGNASITLNSGGLSFNGSNLAGVGTSATNASITLNSNGLAISVGAAVGGGAWTVSDAASSAVVSQLAFTNLNGVTLSLSTGILSAHTIVGSHNGLTSQSNQNVLAANGNFNFQTLSFSNLNGISFGTSAGSAITASHNAITTGRASTDAIGLNAAQTNVTWTVNSSGLSFNAAGYGGTTTAVTGAASITKNSLGLQFNGAGLAGTASGFTGANISGTLTHNTVGLSLSLSVPATSSLVGVSGLSISSAGSTISVYANARSDWNNIGGLAIANAVQGNSLVSIQSFMLEWPLVVSNFMCPISITVGTAANASSAYADVSISGVLYTRNASSLSSIASFSNSLTNSWSSNATASIQGVKAITATMAGTTLTPGNYWLALHLSTNSTATGGANTTGLANTISMILASSVSTNPLGYAPWTAGTNSTNNLYSGMGLISTGATLASIGLSLISGNSTSGFNAPVAFGLRNATYQ